MKHSLIVFAIACVLFLTASTFRQTTAPDPEDYARLFLDVIKKKDQELYVNTFALKSGDIAWMVNEVNDSPHHKDTEKERWRQMLVEDSLRFQERMSKEISESYDKVQVWVLRDSIDLNELQYVTSYFELKYQSGMPFYVCSDLIICLKYKEKYFAVSVDQAMYVNGKWTYGEVERVIEKDQYWKEVYRERYYEADTTASADYDENAAADTVVVVPNKKQQKTLKKIQVLENKTRILYNDLYQ